MAVRIAQTAEESKAAYGPIRDWHYTAAAQGTRDYDLCQLNIQDPNVNFVCSLQPHEYEISREHTLDMVARALAAIVTPWLGGYGSTGPAARA